MRHAPYRTDFGTGRVDFDESGVRALRLPASDVADVDGSDVLPLGVARLVEALEAYFAGRASFVPHSRLTDSVAGSDLIRTIYRVVSEIPPGETMTYREVAAAAGRPRAARVVGAAMAANPLAPMIPCHRVVGSDGSLRGYGGGLAMKQALLDMEGAGADTLDLRWGDR